MRLGIILPLLASFSLLTPTLSAASNINHGSKHAPEFPHCDNKCRHEYRDHLALADAASAVEDAIENFEAWEECGSQNWCIDAVNMIITKSALNAVANSSMLEPPREDFEYAKHLLRVGNTAALNAAIDSYNMLNAMRKNDHDFLEKRWNATDIQEKHSYFTYNEWTNGRAHLPRPPPPKPKQGEFIPPQGPERVLWDAGMLYRILEEPSPLNETLFREILASQKAAQESAATATSSGLSTLSTVFSGTAWSSGSQPPNTVWISASPTDSEPPSTTVRLTTSTKSQPASTVWLTTSTQSQSPSTAWLSTSTTETQPPSTMWFTTSTASPLPSTVWLTTSIQSRPSSTIWLATSPFGAPYWHNISRHSNGLFVTGKTAPSSLILSSGLPPTGGAINGSARAVWHLSFRHGSYFTSSKPAMTTEATHIATTGHHITFAAKKVLAHHSPSSSSSAVIVSPHGNHHRDKDLAALGALAVLPGVAAVALGSKPGYAWINEWWQHRSLTPPPSPGPPGPPRPRPNVHWPEDPPIEPGEPDSPPASSEPGSPPASGEPPASPEPPVPELPDTWPPSPPTVEGPPSPELPGAWPPSPPHVEGPLSPEPPSAQPPSPPPIEGPPSPEPPSAQPPSSPPIEGPPSPESPSSPGLPAEGPVDPVNADDFSEYTVSKAERQLHQRGEVKNVYDIGEDVREVEDVINNFSRSKADAVTDGLPKKWYSRGFGAYDHYPRSRAAKDYMEVKAFQRGLSMAKSVAKESKSYAEGVTESSAQVALGAAGSAAKAIGGPLGWLSRLFHPRLGRAGPSKWHDPKKWDGESDDSDSDHGEADEGGSGRGGNHHNSAHHGHPGDNGSGHSSPGGFDEGSPHGSPGGFEDGSPHVSPGGSPEGSHPGSDHGSPSGSNHGSHAGSNHGSHAGSDSDSPLGSDSDSPLGSDYGSHAGSDHGSHAGSNHGSPPGSDYNSPLGSDYGSPAGSGYGSPPGSDYGSHPGSDYGDPSSSEDGTGSEDGNGDQGPDTYTGKGKGPAHPRPNPTAKPLNAPGQESAINAPEQPAPTGKGPNAPGQESAINAPEQPAPTGRGPNAPGQHSGIQTTVGPDATPTEHRTAQPSPGPPGGPTATGTSLNAPGQKPSLLTTVNPSGTSSQASATSGQLPALTTLPRLGTQNGTWQLTNLTASVASNFTSWISTPIPSSTALPDLSSSPSDDCAPAGCMVLPTSQPVATQYDECTDSWWSIRKYSWIIPPRGSRPKYCFYNNPAPFHNEAESMGCLPNFRTRECRAKFFARDLPGLPKEMPKEPSELPHECTDEWKITHEGWWEHPPTQGLPKYCDWPAGTREAKHKEADHGGCLPHFQTEECRNSFFYA